ncbi:ABC transporter, transmembrane domain, type 1 [Penicillium griseofulvum]|uniref:ABC transporter, transmembrane domain, type 1 n=1 Tax=Penicillium patulum TaxID=5078 RepID=A0A135LWX0_PENPA|nr:ABC transporter, transmembrane domain, type 1 [Penicillium griseofulvum]KXG53458.1 ABC transporter, transmembrane domain, type 1 [Penicillium griseofulvum]
MSHLIGYVSDPPTGDTARIRGFKLLSVTMLIYVGSALFNGRREAAKRRAMIAVKGSLIGILHEKTLQCNDDGHSALGLMTNDVEELQMAFGWAHVIWSSFISLSLGLYLLASRLGWASIIPLMLVLLTSQCGRYATKHFVKKRRAWNDATRFRVGLTKALLENLKPIKMMGYSHVMESKVRAARDNELRAGLVTSQLDVIMAASGSFSNVVSPAITLALYIVFARTSGNVALDADLLFTSFALIQMVTLPATSIMFLLPELVEAMAGFDRLQKFLLQPDHQDNCKLLEGQVKHFLAYIWGDQFRHDDDYAILMKFATVRYETSDLPVLNNINLEIRPGWLVLVVGATGSGKTTLAKTILGDVRLQSGSVSTSPNNIAFCAQSPWLRDGTIRDIIAGPPGCRVTDEKWYQRVLHACDLEVDLFGLPNGDNTVVSGGGMSLSAGQKERLALARAVYSGLDIIILDDALSSVDEETASRVMQRLLGPTGLLRELNKTVVMITDSKDLLGNSDLIVILNPDGTICEQGVWDDPKVQSCYNELDPQPDIELPQDKPKKEIQQMNVPRPDYSMPEESMDVLLRPVNSTIYKQYVATIGVYRFLVAIFIFLSSAAFVVFIQTWFRMWTEDEAGGKRITFYIGVYFALTIGHWVSLTGIGTIKFLVVPTFGRALHDQLLTTVIKAPLSFITSTDIETTLSRFSEDMMQIDRKIPREIVALGSQTFKLLAQITLLSASQKYNLIVLPVFAIIVYVIQGMYLVTSRQIKKLCMETRSLPNDSFVETAQGMVTIRAFGWEKAYSLENSRALDASQSSSYTLHVLEQSFGLVLDLIVAGVVLVHVAFIVTFTGTTMTAGDVGISMNVILMLNMTLMTTVQSWANFDTSLNMVSRIRSFATTVAPETQPSQQYPIPKLWPSSGEMDLVNVVVSQGKQPAASVNTTVDVSFKMAPVHKIAVCGPTGSGKSSLLLSFLRMIDLSEGTIIIDGLDLSSISRDLIRSRIITIPQDSFIILNDTVRENLDVLGITTDKKIVETLKKVHLWSSLESRAIDFGLSRTFYLDMPMKAWPLSESQMQLISLARALLLRSPRGKILLFEESTSKVDTETSKFVQEVIDEEFRDSTIIVVGHRLETISNSDSIIVMDKGGIVEAGSFNDLRQKQGAFRSLLDSSAL